MVVWFPFYSYFRYKFVSVRLCTFWVEKNENNTNILRSRVGRTLDVIYWRNRFFTHLVPNKCSLEPTNLIVCQRYANTNRTQIKTKNMSSSFMKNIKQCVQSFSFSNLHCFSLFVFHALYLFLRLINCFRCTTFSNGKAKVLKRID